MRWPEPARAEPDAALARPSRASGSEARDAALQLDASRVQFGWGAQDAARTFFGGGGADADADAGASGECEGPGCACQNGETRPCYSGAAESFGRGACAAGVQRCEHARFGACQDERLPQAESCANPGVDDDCDGRVDENSVLGQPCILQQQAGACAQGTLQCVSSSGEPTCVAAAPVAESCNSIDDDCDGQIDEGFVLASDPKHCGACGAACAAEQVCCAGQCQTTLPDGYLAACGGQCAEPGTIQCDGSCSAPDPDDYARACGHCGGSVQCDGSCSQPDPPDYGATCSDGISQIGCSGGCECVHQCPNGQVVPCTRLCLLEL